MGVKKVRFIFHEEWIWMVAVRGLGKEIIVLLTNLKIEGKEDLLKILEIYLTRWKCEESYRFIKQAYHLEDVRVRKFNSLRNILAILMSVFFFLSVVIGEKLRLQILLKKKFMRRLKDSTKYLPLNIMPSVTEFLIFSSGKNLPPLPYLHLLLSLISSYLLSL